jgi:hypothetical protein
MHLVYECNFYYTVTSTCFGHSCGHLQGDENKKYKYNYNVLMSLHTQNKIVLVKIHGLKSTILTSMKYWKLKSYCLEYSFVE